MRECIVVLTLLRLVVALTAEVVFVCTLVAVHGVLFTIHIHVHTHVHVCVPVPDLMPP